MVEQRISSLVSLLVSSRLRLRRRMRHDDSRSRSCRQFAVSGGTFGRRLFIFLARYPGVVIGRQWELLVTVGHSQVGDSVVEVLKGLPLARPWCGLQRTAPGQMVESDRRGAVGQDLGELLYLCHPGQALPDISLVLRRVTGRPTVLPCLRSGPLRRLEYLEYFHQLRLTAHSSKYPPEAHF